MSRNVPVRVLHEASIIRRVRHSFVENGCRCEWGSIVESL